MLPTQGPVLGSTSCTSSHAVLTAIVLELILLLRDPLKMSHVSLSLSLPLLNELAPWGEA